MSELAFIHFCELVIAISAIAGIILILMATWHDLRVIANKKTLAILTQRLPRSRQPSVAVLVYAYNNHATLLDCLESIRNNGYDNYQIVVINNASSDQTSRLLTTYKRTYSTVPLHTYKRRKMTDRLTALRAGYKKARSAELILIHNADSILPVATIKKSAARFITNERITFIHLRRFVAFDYSVISLITTLLSLSRNMIAKAWPRINGTAVDGSQGSVIVRTSQFLKQQPSAHSTSTYAQTLIYRPVSSSLRNTTPHRRLLPTLGVILISLVGFVMVTYFLITAAVLRSSSLLVISWLMVCIWLLATIWSDEATGLRTKIELSLATPFMYFVLYAYTGLKTIARIVTIGKILPAPRLSLHTLRHAIQVELYSTRY